MKAVIVALVAAVSMSGAVAAPSVTVIGSEQENDAQVLVKYALSGEPAIVTLAVETNRGDGVWVSIGPENINHAFGDVNRVVPVGEERTIRWIPYKSWPGKVLDEGKIRFGVKAWSTNAPPDYMVVSLTAANTVRFYECAEAIPGGGPTTDLYKTELLVMRKIPAGGVEWRMGSPTTEKGRYGDREAPHAVTLAEDYYMGVYPVTQRQYELLMDDNPSNFKSHPDYPTRPVEMITYSGLRGTSKLWPGDLHKVDDDSFMDVIRRKTGVDGFDLPTEAQWEFAARAESGTAFPLGYDYEGKTTSANLAIFGRYEQNGGKIDGSTMPDADSSADHGTAKVGTYKANKWGLYDVVGNVWEFCLDWYQADLSSVDPAIGPESGTARAMRGGAWSYASNLCRLAFRSSFKAATQDKNIGFRLCCPAIVHE